MFRQISRHLHDLKYRWFSSYVIAAMLVDENKRSFISSFRSCTRNCSLPHCYLSLEIGSKQTTIWSIYVVVRTRTAKKCTKMRNALAGPAEPFLLFIKPIASWRSRRRRKFPFRKRSLPFETVDAIYNGRLHTSLQRKLKETN